MIDLSGDWFSSGSDDLSEGEASSEAPLTATDKRRLIFVDAAFSHQHSPAALQLLWTQGRLTREELSHCFHRIAPQESLSLELFGWIAAKGVQYQLETVIAYDLGLAAALKSGHVSVEQVRKLVPAIGELPIEDVLVLSRR